MTNYRSPWNILEEENQSITLDIIFEDLSSQFSAHTIFSCHNRKFEIEIWMGCFGSILWLILAIADEAANELLVHSYWPQFLRLTHSKLSVEFMSTNTLIPTYTDFGSNGSNRYSSWAKYIRESWSHVAIFLNIGSKYWLANHFVAFWKVSTFGLQLDEQFQWYLRKGNPLPSMNQYQQGKFEKMMRK